MKFGGKSVAAIIEFPFNKILLVKRATVVFKGYWALPGGRVDPGETVEQTVIREVREETGLNIEIVSEIGKYHEIGVQDEIEYDYHPTCFLVKPIGGKIKRQEEEIKKIKLFDLDDIPKKLAFEHPRMIQDYMRVLEMTKIDEEIRKCTSCRLHKTRTNAVPGEGPANAKIMMCGQAPGRTEDKQGKPFVGMAGKFLDKSLRSIKLSRERIFITSTIKCFPPKNRPPKPDELKACKPFLKEQIRTIKPKIIIALGNYALQTLTNKETTISKLQGEPQEGNNIFIFPTFHPAVAMRFPKYRALMEEDFKKLRDLLENIR